MGLLNLFKNLGQKKDVVHVPVYTVETKILGCRFECDRYRDTNRQQVVEGTKIESKLRLKKPAFGVASSYYVLSKYRGAWVDCGVLSEDLAELLEDKYNSKEYDYETTATDYYFTYGKNYQYDCDDCKKDCGDCNYKAKDQLKIGLKIKIEIYEK